MLTKEMHSYAGTGLRVYSEDDRESPHGEGVHLVIAGPRGGTPVTFPLTREAAAELGRHLTSLGEED